MADDREGSGGEISASELDDLTHAELLMLYQDSTVSVRFARERQWKLVGAALLLFAAIVAIPELVDISTFAANAWRFRLTGRTATAAGPRARCPVRSRRS